MNPRLLIDSIVQQTTVLIAQLSTAAGLRSPLSHVADQVFLSLAQEIENQGVGRKVVADMFGLALRSYQRKVQRLEESGTVPGQSLWEAALEYVTESGPVRRDDVQRRFRHDDELAVSAVLSDLVTTGLVYSSGRGESTVYGVTSEADRSALSSDDGIEDLALLLWGFVFRTPGSSIKDVLQFTRAPEAKVREAVRRLLEDGRLTGDSEDAPLHAASYVIHAGAAQGWEAAVFDHYQALANAVIAKLRQRTSGAPPDETVGGTTLHFGIYPGHPYEERVKQSLGRLRRELGALWQEVAEYNKAHPIVDEEATRVTLYFGQSVRSPSDSVAPNGSEVHTRKEERSP
jgi:hypothetical protein